MVASQVKAVHHGERSFHFWCRDQDSGVGEQKRLFQGRKNGRNGVTVNGKSLSYIIIFQMNPFPYRRLYNILWALERILEVDYNLNLRNSDRYRLYQSLSLAIVKVVRELLFRHTEVVREGQERVIFLEQYIPEVIDTESDEDIPDLIDEDGNVVDR